MKHPYNSLYQKLGQAIADFQMIQDRDRIGIGLSGGKDSVLMLWLLARLQKIAPVKFDLAAITVDLGFGADFSSLQKFCAELGVPWHLEPTTIGQIVFADGSAQNPCALCAHLRRGTVNNLAKKLNCNKVALAHHANDAVETLLMSMFYTGRITTFKPNTYLSRLDLWVIRPLVYIPEAAIREAAASLHLPIVANPCPANGKTKRQEVKEILAELEEKIPGLFPRLLRSLSNVDSEQMW